MLLLLDALSVRTQQWRHGYELIKETGLQSGTLYPLLMRMSEQGWSKPSGASRSGRVARPATPIA